MTHQKQVSERFFTPSHRVACGGGVQRMGAASPISPCPLQNKAPAVADGKQYSRLGSERSLVIKSNPSFIVVTVLKIYLLNEIEVSGRFSIALFWSAVLLANKTPN